MKKAILVYGILFSSFSFAAQTAKVVVDSASIYDQPQATGSVVDTVAKDTTIAVSNIPTNGFFKSRIPSGVVGWISGNDILTGPGAAATPAPEAVTPEPTPIPARAAQKPAPAKKTVEKKKSLDDASDQSRILISGGMQILSNSGFTAAIPITGSTTSFGGTFEMQFKLSDLFHWAGRLEYFTGSSSQVVSSTVNQTMAFHALPLMAGIIYDPISKKDFRISLGGYVGVALMTSMTIAQTSATKPSVVYASSDLCEYLNAQGSYAVSSSFSLLAELGYRLHNGSYPASAALGLPAITPNYGGLVTRLGVEFRL